MSTAISESLSSGTLKRCGSSFNSEKTFKRVKSEVVTCRSLDGFIAPHAQASRSHLVQKTPTPAANRLDADAARDDGATMDAVTQEMPVSSDSNRPEDSTAAIHLATESDSSLSTPSIQLPPNPRSEVTTSIKATHFRHLKQMYLSELEYMLREFEKLERQLLGAKTASGSAAAESAASRERREKLHSFIQHLEDTIQQIVTGVELETAGQPTCPTRLDGDTGLSAHLSQEKEEEENVQKIEEHILANLLPVKVRLKKQLAAQQGAKHNPAGMPPVRGGGMMMMQTDAAKQGKATFLKAVPERRPSQFGKALNGGGSNLTQKLHGPTLGSADRCHGHGVGQDNGPVVEPVPSLAEEKGKSKVLYAGLALGSKQILSSVTAARSVHKLSIQDPVLLKVENELHSMVHKTSSSSPTSIDLEDLKLASSSPLQLDDIAASDDDDDAEPDHIYSKHGTQLSLAAQAAIVSYEERRKVRKMRRKKKKLLLQQQQEKAAAAVAALPKRKKIVKKRGPRNVEYMCALCNEIYNSTCDYNPWWALSQHDCPKCGKMQVSLALQF